MVVWRWQRNIFMSRTYKKVSWNIHHEQFAKLLWPMPHNTVATYSYYHLCRTYITSIINSLMIYGIFILFYSLSCPTAHYKYFSLPLPLPLHFYFYSQSNKIFNKIIFFHSLSHTPPLFTIILFCCIFKCIPHSLRHWIKFIFMLFFPLTHCCCCLIGRKFIYDDWVIKGYNDWNVSWEKFVLSGKSEKKK